MLGASRLIGTASDLWRTWCRWGPRPSLTRRATVVEWRPEKVMFPFPRAGDVGPPGLTERLQQPQQRHLHPEPTALTARAAPSAPEMAKRPANVWFGTNGVYGPVGPRHAPSRLLGAER